MKHAKLLTLFCLIAVLVAPSLSMGEEFLLYEPKPAEGDKVPASPDRGVLVRRVTVQRGDTLKHLSKKHIGVASYFPQVLLFNTIKNPDLIHPGEKLLIPVRAGHAEPAASVKKSAKAKKSHVARRHSLRHKPSAEHATSEMPAATFGEQESYQRAKRAYMSGEFQKLLQLFDGFLRKFPKSKLAAYASLYRADCFLRLSGQ